MSKREVTFKHDFGEIELTVTASVTLGMPAKIYGEPEDCYPAEDAEVEILEVLAPNSWSVQVDYGCLGQSFMGRMIPLEDVLKENAITAAVEMD